MGPDDVNDEQHESNVDSTPWDVSNGFLRRNKPIYHDQSAPISVPTSDVGATATAKDHARHLISQRGFEDILQACRPRNRGEYGSGLPISLSNLLRKFSPNMNHSIQASEKTFSSLHQVLTGRTPALGEPEKLRINVVNWKMTKCCPPTWVKSGHFSILSP